jgi:hypothetical protein
MWALVLGHPCKTQQTIQAGNATGNISQGQLLSNNTSFLNNLSLFYGVEPGPGDYFTLVNGHRVLVHVYTVDELMPYILPFTLLISLVFGYIGYRFIGLRISRQIQKKKAKKEEGGP